MTQYFLIKRNESNLVVVVDDDSLLAAKTKADRKVFFKETKESTEDFLRTVENMDWKSWKTMPDTEFHDMTEAMDPDHAEVLVRYKVYSDEEVPSQWGIENGHSVLEPIAKFPRTLKAMRNELGYSMKKITDLLEIPYRTWQDWEAGKREPAKWTMNLLLEKLERMVEDRKMNKNLVNLASKLYDYIDHDVEGIQNDWDNDYLTENTGKDGKDYLWYMDENICIAISEETEEIIKDDELDKLFGLCEEKDFEGMEWGSLTCEDQEELLKEANAIDGETGNNMVDDGDCIIDLVYPLSVPGKVEDGEIVIDDEAVIYNPCK